MKKIADPSAVFLRTMMSLYFTSTVTPMSGEDEAVSLPPMDALVLGMICLNKTYNSEAFRIRLLSYKLFNARECGIFSETGFLNLVDRGYLSPASKKALQALAERDGESWGLGKVPFVVTAKGAKRIGYLVANLRGENVQEVIKNIQAESKEAAKAWDSL